MTTMNFIAANAHTSSNVNPNINMTNAIIDDTGAGAEAAITIQRDGDLLHQRFNGTTDTIADEWILDSLKNATVGDDYEVRATLTSGILDNAQSDSTGVWLDLGGSSQRSWLVSDDSGTGNADVTVEIRDKATQTVQASADFTITVV